MKVKVQNLDGGKAGNDIELSDDVFGVEPRADILHRVVTWQLEKRRGTARGARERSDVARTGKKRSEEHTSELQSLMRISYAVFCLKKKKKTDTREHLQPPSPQKSPLTRQTLPTPQNCEAH